MGEPRKPNLLFVLTDQMRAQDMGCAGNSDIRTPNIDGLAEEGVRFTTAVSSCPVCTPYRACLLTGRYPLTTGMFMNDLLLPLDEATIAKALRDAGYRTGYIGKWHLDGGERSAFTPPGERRQGFEFWMTNNCTHSYLDTFWYHDDPEPIRQPGRYAPDYETDVAVGFLRDCARDDQPFFLLVSWAPPHSPCQVLLEPYLSMYSPDGIAPRENIDPEIADMQEIAHYYGQISALDSCLGRLLSALKENDLDEDTIIVFTSDHGDMLGSQGVRRKQWPWDESALAPLLFRWPSRIPGRQVVDAPIGTVDLMPTLLSMMGVPTPSAVEGADLSHLALGQEGPAPSSAFMAIVAPFSEQQVMEWRAIRTPQHLYARNLEGPWLLYDSEADPFQRRNLIDDPAHRDLAQHLDQELQEWLRQTGDDFSPRTVLHERYGLQIRETDWAIPYWGEGGAPSDSPFPKRQVPRRG